MPHTDKQYRKLLRTYKFVIYMVLAAMFVIGVGLLFIWLYDKLDGSFMSRGWQIFFMITFALLAAALQIPEYREKENANVHRHRQLPDALQDPQPRKRKQIISPPPKS